MTATSTPFGIRPAYSPQGMASARSYPNGIASGYGTGILKYQPVALNSSGNIVAATVGSDIIGVFAGLFYIDNAGIPHEENQWIAGTTYNNASGSVAQGYGIDVWVWDDRNMVFSIQSDGATPIAQSNGAQLNFSNIASGSTTTGLSACTAGSASLTTSGQAQLRIVALDPTINNSWSDAYTILQVQIAQSQYVANKIAV